MSLSTRLRSWRSDGLTAFTLLEMMVVIVIIAILAVFTFPVFQWYRERARKIACQENLKGLYVATSAYVNSNGDRWPQIRFESIKVAQYAEGWMEVLSPFGIGWSNFICPEVQNKLRNPNYTDPGKHRTDYIAGVFDDKPGTCRKWARQPWFVERQDAHGTGNLMILTDGSLLDLTQAQELGKQPN